MMNRFKFTALVCGFCILGIITTPFSAAMAEQKSQEEELFFVAQKAFDDGFYDVAIRYIEQFLRKFPSTKHYAKARLLYGQCYFFKNQYLKSFEIFQSLLNEPELRDATLYWMGETYFKGSDYRQAQSYYQKVIDQFPDSEYAPQAHYSLGWSFFEQGIYDEAIKHFHQLIDVFQDHPLREDALFKVGEAYLNTSDYTKAISTFEEYIKLYPKSDRIVNAFFYSAEGSYYADDLLTANTYYAKAAELSKDPKISFMSKIGMGWIYLKLKKNSLSERHFKDAENLAKEYSFSNEEIWLGEGALYTETERYSDALRTYENFLNNFPRNVRVVDAFIGKANALYLLQNYPEAVAAYQYIISYAENNFVSKDVLGKCYYGIAWSYLKQGDTENAIKVFQTIMDKTDSAVIKASALSQIGDAYQEANQLQKALASYDRILNEYAETLYADYAQFQQGITLLKMEEIEAAASSFQSLKTNFPDSSHLIEADYYLGFAHFQKQEWADSILYIQNFLDRSTKTNPFLTQAKYILALSYFHLDDSQKAIGLFRNIVKKVDSQPSVQQTADIFIGKCLYHLNKSAEAIKHFRQICQSYPLTEAHQDALLWLGAFYLERSDFKNAIPFYVDFIENFPGSNRADVAYYELGQAYLGTENLEKSLNTLNKVPDTADPEIFTKAQLSIAEIFSREMGPKKALETYRQIADKVPEYKRDALVKIAKIYEEWDNPQEAISMYQLTLDTAQNMSRVSNAEILFSIADNYELLNDRNNAVEKYLKIPYLSGEETLWAVKAYLRVARIFEDREDWEQAKTIYLKILKLNVDESKYAQERIEWIDNYSKN